MNLIATGLAEKHLLGDLLNECPDTDRKLIEDSLDRHETRMRAKGVPGW